MEVQHRGIANGVVLASHVVYLERQQWVVLDGRLCILRRKLDGARQRGIAQRERDRRYEIARIVIERVGRDVLIEIMDEWDVARVRRGEHAGRNPIAHLLDCREIEGEVGRKRTAKTVPNHGDLPVR